MAWPAAGLSSSLVMQLLDSGCDKVMEGDFAPRLLPSFLGNDVLSKVLSGRNTLVRILVDLLYVQYLLLEGGTNFHFCSKNNYVGLRYSTSTGSASTLMENADHRPIIYHLSLTEDEEPKRSENEKRGLLNVI